MFPLKFLPILPRLFPVILYGGFSTEDLNRSRIWIIQPYFIGNGPRFDGEGCLSLIFLGTVDNLKFIGDLLFGVIV